MKNTLTNNYYYCQYNFFNLEDNEEDIPEDIQELIDEELNNEEE
jgi:hypothetical protein